jgi:hypothetical protein
VEAVETAFSKMTIAVCVLFKTVFVKIWLPGNLAARKTKREGQPPSRQEFY